MDILEYLIPGRRAKRLAKEQAERTAAYEDWKENRYRELRQKKSDADRILAVRSARPYTQSPAKASIATSPVRRGPTYHAEIENDEAVARRRRDDSVDDGRSDAQLALAQLYVSGAFSAPAHDATPSYSPCPAPSPSYDYSPPAPAPSYCASPPPSYSSSSSDWCSSSSSDYSSSSSSGSDWQVHS